MARPSICPNCNHSMKFHTSFGCRYPRQFYATSPLPNREVKEIPKCDCDTTPQDFDVHPLTEAEL